MSTQMDEARKVGRAESEVIAAAGSTGDETARKLGLAYTEGAEVVAANATPLVAPVTTSAQPAPAPKATRKKAASQ
jgi:hypothetical protein